MSVVCPKCASPDALSLSLIHREGLPGECTRSISDAAPPSKRNVIGWTMVAAGFALLFVLSIRHFAFPTVLYAGATLVGVWIVRSNRAFNATQFPELYDEWMLSFRCSRCGSVFLAS
jgi:hypothetical protein